MFKSKLPNIELDLLNVDRTLTTTNTSSSSDSILTTTTTTQYPAVIPYKSSVSTVEIPLREPVEANKANCIHLESSWFSGGFKTYLLLGGAMTLGFIGLTYIYKVRPVTVQPMVDFSTGTIPAELVDRGYNSMVSSNSDVTTWRFSNFGLSSQTTHKVIHELIKK